MTPAVYLDIDGVLNGRGSRGPDVISDDPVQRARWAMAPSRVRLVDDLCLRAGASVVVSSSWRLAWSWADLRDALRAGGLRARVLGVTSPDIEDRWLAIEADVTHAPLRPWVALDDERPPDRWHLRDRVVVTDWDAGGITGDDVDRALEVLCAGS